MAVPCWTTPRRRSECLHRGMALMMVIFAIAVAAILSCALLASGSLQAQAGGNAVRGAMAEHLAESGVNLALWHLQNSNGTWTGKNGISLGSSVPGVIDITCTPNGNNVFSVTSTATLNGMQRIAHAEVELVTPMTVTSDSPGLLAGLLHGVLELADNLINTLLEGHAITLTNTQVLTQIPIGAQQLYSPLHGTYGQSGAGQVFWVSGDATLENDLVIRGQLIVTGDLTIAGAGIRITRTLPTPVSETRPAALIVGGKVVPADNAQATIDGGMWVGTQMSNDSEGEPGLPAVGIGSELTVNGPLMIGDGGIKDTYKGLITVRPLVRVISRD